MYTLRSYQQEAVSKMLWDMQNEGNSIVCVAQGGGKSIIIADFANKLGRPILILQPTKELLEQNMEKLKSYVPESEIGVFSASMSRKDVNIYTFATIQSVYKHPEMFEGFDVAIVDECDLIPMKKMNSMYGKFFRGAGIKKVIGMTGTPFKQDTYYKEPPQGWAIWKQQRWKNYRELEVITTTKMLTRYQNSFWSRMLCVINTQDLLDEGYLSPLRYTDATLIEHKDIPLNQGRSEFDYEAFDNMILSKERDIVRGIVDAASTHKKVLVFCNSIEQTERFSQILSAAKTITGQTPKKERKQIVDDFREGKIKILLNVEVLTVGFDCPDLDCIVLARPTRSLRLHTQILGRGTRKSEDKTHCDVIDYAGNVRSLGELAKVKVQKVNNLWNVVSDSFPNGYHMAPLYEFTIARR
jgi:DNA repair protein RadD